MSRLSILDGPEKWALFRQVYAEGWDIGNPYPIDWIKYFTPIECHAWSSIRGYGVNLKPQYPIGRIFADFADPEKKIILECDGAAYHNVAKDKLRDQKLVEKGWTVYRVTGSECAKPDFDFDVLHDEDIDDTIDDQIREWAVNSSDGLIAALSWRYYGMPWGDRIAKHFPKTLWAHQS